MPPSRTARPTGAGAQSLRQVLATSVLDGAEVLAGADGLDRLVERLNVMEVPDILPWVKPAEFLLTTAYPLRETPDALPQLVADLDDAGLAGLGIKLGRYLDELPPAMLAIADERAFPVVRLPDGISFDDILNEVLTGILNEQAQRLARSERIHRAFLQIVLMGHGLDHIVTELADLIDAPALIVSADGHVLAMSRCPEGAGLGVGDEVVVADDTVRADGATLPCRTAPVSAGGRLHGRVVGLPPEGGADAVEPDVRMALESAATVAALAITKQLELQAVESKYQSDLMHDLLAGRVDQLEDVLARARLFGWQLERRLIALVVQFDEPPTPAPPGEHARRDPLATAVAAQVRERDPGAAVVRFSDEMVVLTAAFDGDDGRARARRFAADLARAGSHATGASVSVGLSRPVTELRAVPDAYGQATRALQIGRKLRGRGASAHFDDLGVYRVLNLIDDIVELRAFATETLGELSKDTEQATDLRHTLEVLLETNCNVAEAARRLHFHYNTLRYRIEKLEGIVGPFMTDAATRLDVHLALLILGMAAVRGG